MERNQYAAILQRAFSQPTARILSDGEVPEVCVPCRGSGLVLVAKRGVERAREYEYGPCPACYVPPSVEARLTAAGIVNPTSFVEWRDDPLLAEAKHACLDLVAGLRPTVFLRGGPGVGKTHLAKATGKAFIEGNRTVLFKKVPRMLDDLRSTFNRVDRMQEGETKDQMAWSLTGQIDLMRDVDLLILDDFGAHQHTEWASDKLYTVIDDRYEAKKPLLVTTNVKASEEREHIRTLDRLSPGVVWIKPQAKSKREPIVIAGGESRRGA